MDFGAKLELLRPTPYLRSLPAPERVGTSITMSACCLTPAPPSNSVNSSAQPNEGDSRQRPAGCCTPGFGRTARPECSARRIRW